MGVKTSKSSSRSLDRSVSAPTLGSPKRSPAETVCPGGARSVRSLPEGPAALGREDLPLTSLNLSDRDASTHVDASLAGTEQSRRPSSPSLNTRAKPVASGHPKPSCAEGSGPGPAPSAEEAEGGGALPCASTGAGEGPVLPSSPLERSQAGPQPPEELGTERPADQLQAARAPEKGSAPAASPCPPREHALSEDSDAEDREWKLSCGGDLRQDSAPPHQPPGNETLMEVEGTDPALIAAGAWPPEQDARPSAERSECSVMETESAQPSPPPLSTDPFSTSDWKPSGRRTFDSTETPVSTGFSGSPPPPPPEGPLGCQAEEAPPSLASALKELHQLLVVSYKRASGNEGGSRPRALPGNRAADERACEGKPQERRAPESQDAALSSPAGRPEGVHSGVAAGVQCSGAGAEEGQRTLEQSDEGALIITEPAELDSNSSIGPRPSAASGAPPGGECSEMPCLSSDQTAGGEALEQHPPPPSLTQGSESQNPPQREPGMPASSSTGEPGAPSPSSQEIDSAAPQPPVFPSADIDQIVRAGFTPQEASEALERTGGEVDLALLILLAKKIVVPT